MVSSSPGPTPFSPVDVNTYVPEVVDVWPRLHGDSRYYLCLQGRSDQVFATSNLIESLTSRQCRLAWPCAIPHWLITSAIINTSDSMISTLTINPFNVNLYDSGHLGSGISNVRLSTSLFSCHHLYDLRAMIRIDIYHWAKMSFERCTIKL